ncbi:hypothetical protein OJF2_42540 [Aquisphaera giovannonii]|uniref:SbsA Ig-like domain-containing protein n=1 Tax=Aquisphaera giovannonii TaxID=406548 RepID=A0A5B9W5U6_9BACT|nr:hypothetical protein [Aquisphaera giovannonii]QEH35697.1 hypothetical protein OJF2_42540 [Aquisphaera giovannonii]
MAIRPARAFVLCTLPAAMALATPPASPSEAGPSVVLRRDGGKSTVDVRGLDPADLRRLAESDRDGRRWASLLAVFVADEGQARAPRPDPPPVLGSYRVEDGVLRFEPRFPFVPGLRYRAAFRPGELPGREKAAPGPAPITLEFALPKPAAATPTTVRQVYPSRSTLPENQLRFYVHFSAPMRQGSVYDFIHLLDAGGTEIDGAFLRLDEELWDRDGLRLTLLIDPGRIKRDVGPREGFGPVLEAGRDYTLLIDARWPDAEGRPLAGPHRKAFRTTAADDACPDVGTWRIRPPDASSVAPLVVESPEPLDHALFARLVRVQDADGHDVPGRAAVAGEETRWAFTPDRPWRPGAYRLVVDEALEDLAGNNLRRPFELDVFEPVGRRIEARVVDRPFEIRPGP